MLQPSEGFTAKEVQFLQYEAAEWIQHVNKQIIAAASEGKSEVYIDISSRNPVGEKYWLAPDALIEHFKARGFSHRFNGQCSTIFSWEVKTEGELHTSPRFEFNGEKVDGNGLKEKIKIFLFGEKAGGDQ